MNHAYADEKYHGRTFDLKIPKILAMYVTGNFFSGMIGENSGIQNDTVSKN